MTPGERWLATLWPLVRARLPAPPARVLDVGCGPLGGFVPFLRFAGYEAAGVDPKAPDTADYHRIEFEHAELPQRIDAVIASTSLHHVNDPAHVIDSLTQMLTGDGTLVVVEWAWEYFDEATARWCFERLGRDDEANWLYRLRDGWAASEQGWLTYLASWATHEGVHRGEGDASPAGRTVRASASAFWPVLLSRSVQHDRRGRAGRNHLRAHPLHDQRHEPAARLE